jgi:hypothetical protein
MAASGDPVQLPPEAQRDIHATLVNTASEQPLLQVEDIATPEAAPHIYRSHSAGGSVTLSIDGDFLRVDVAGELLDGGIVTCFREALAAGRIHPNMMTLVDLSDFKGGIDWTAIHTIAGLAPWGTAPGPAPRVAFVTKSVWFSAMLKLASILFPATQHRQFSGTRNAMLWLRATAR